MVSMTIEDADKKSSKQSNFPIRFHFTTSSVLSIGGTITISLPSNYFTGPSTPLGSLNPVSGGATLSGCTMTAATLVIVCTTASAALPAGAQSITFAAGQLITGTSVVPFSGNVSVKTNLDSFSDLLLCPILSFNIDFMFLISQ